LSDRAIHYLIAGIILFTAHLAYSKEPTKSPILRIETGMHTSLIRRIAVDAPRNRLITCSDDKTIRVWQMPEKRLVSTLRIPIDEGHEGQLFGLAVSPDGKTVAAGGWTGWDWEGKASVYLFDIDSGDLTRRLSGFRDAIHALAWSPDGKHLAVGLQGRAGLDVVRIADGKTIASDSQYLDKLTDIDFASNGRMLAISLDGMARLYSPDFRLIGRKKMKDGDIPVAIKFSPDASLFAVGFHDKPVVSVASGKDMSVQYHVETEGLQDQVNFMTVVWSSDGDYLYAAGDYRGQGLNPLYRWSKQGRGPREKIPLSNLRIPEIQQMPNGHIAFSTEDPGFGVISSDNKLVSYRYSDIVDHSKSGTHFLISEDGLVVSYPLNQGGQQQVFSALSGGDQILDRAPTELLFLPITEAEGFEIKGWKNGYKPSINNKIPQFDDYELSRSYAISPDHKKLLLGTEWALRLYDQDTREQWNVKLAAVVWAVNISRNGRLAVAALSDGTIRWYRMTDGKEVLSYFPHVDGKEWIAWLPSGYYISSVYGDNYIGWHMNRGMEMAPDFFRAVQFDRILYRPDVVRKHLQNYIQTKTRGLINKEINEPFDISRLSEIAPPRLKIRLGKVKLQGSSAYLGIQLSGEKNSLEMKDYVVYINNIPVTPTQERHLQGADTSEFKRQMVVPLTGRANEIRVEAFNGISMGVVESYLALPDEISITVPRGNLYLLAIGVNEFPKLSEDVALAYAVNDAEEMEETFKKYGGAYFSKVFTKLISDNADDKPDRGVISDALAFIHQAQSEDTVIIFLASHGISDEAGNYYFVPRDAVPEDLDRLMDGGVIESLMPWNNFFDALRLSAGKRLLVVDTCQARNIEGRFESHSLMKRSASSLFSLMLASKGDEESQEHPASKHGLFTYSLLHAMTPTSDTDDDGVLTLRELYHGVSPIMEGQRDKRIGPQTPQLIAPQSVVDYPLLRVVH